MNKSSEQVVAESHRAQGILDDPVFVEAVDRLEARWIADWRKSADGDPHFWALLRALSDVKRELENTVGQGVIEAAKSRRITNRN